MNSKKVIFAILLIIPAFSILYSITGQNSQDNPVIFSISDGSSGTAAPYLFIKNTSTYTNLAIVNGTNSDKTYSFEDANDYDFNDIVVQVYITDNNSDSPSIFVTELKKDASYDHEIWLSINIPSGHRALFAGTYYDSGIQNIRVFQSSSAALGQTVEIKIVPSEDFSISVAPTSNTIQQGGSGIYSVSVAFLNGYSGSVILSASNLPAYSTATFKPNPVPGSAGETNQSELTINVGNKTPVGKYSFTIKGESTLKTKEISAEIEIIEAPDFAMNVDSESVRIEPGKTASYVINIKPIAGFKDKVSLFAESLPTGFTASLEPNSITKEGYSSLNISVPKNALAGTYSFTLKGTSGKIIHYLKLSVEVFTYTAELSLTKQADKNNVTIGEEVTFTIICANSGDVPLKDVVVTDSLEDAFQYISASSEPTVNGSQLTFNIGDIGIGESKTISIKSKITAAAELSGSASNYATASCDRILYKRSNTVNINIGVPSLSLTKNLRNANPNFKPGGIVIYEINLKNRGSAPVYDLKIRDLLPNGFFYINGRTVINGTVASDPDKIESELIWKIAKLDPGKELVIIYQVSISADAKTGRHLNSVEATAVDGSGKSLTAGPAQVLVIVSRGTILLYSVIEGTVFEDLDSDGYFGVSDRPVANIWVMLEQGEKTKTDVNGEFIFENVIPGEHFISVDIRTLSNDLEPAKKFYIANPLEGGREYIDIPLTVKAEGRIEGKLIWDSALTKDITSFSLEGLKVMLDEKYHILTEDNGSFAFEGVPVGTHSISIPSEFLPQGISIKTADTMPVEVNQRKTTVVEFILNGNPFGTLTGRVIAVRSFFKGQQSTVPVEGITLILNNDIKVLSDSTGVFKFDQLIPGKYQINADLITLEKMHYRMKSANTLEVEIAAGKTQTIEIQLESLAFLEIKIKK